MADFSNVMLFSKHLQGLRLEAVAPLVRDAGITALDLTVRRGGHVEPDRVETDLPACATLLERHGVRIGKITTDITDARDATAERVLRTAAALGVRYYKLGYYRYRGFGTLRQQIREVAAKLRDLAEMNVALGLVGGYHNHSADFFGANVGDIDEALQHVDPRGVGVYWDAAHATIEGGSDGWRQGLDRIAPRLVMLAVKDFRWVDIDQGYAGGRRHSVQFCPLAEGNTPWPQILATLHTTGFDGPMSFHSEYQGPFSFRDLTVREVIEQTATDVEHFRRWAADTPASGR